MHFDLGERLVVEAWEAGPRRPYYSAMAGNSLDPGARGARTQVLVTSPKYRACETTLAIACRCVDGNSQTIHAKHCRASGGAASHDDAQLFNSYDADLSMEAILRLSSCESA